MDEEKRRRAFLATKDHVKIDEKSKIITEYTVTDASVHDSQETTPLVDDSDKVKPLYADSADAGAPIAKALKKIGGRTRFTNALKGINPSPMSRNNAIGRSRKYAYVSSMCLVSSRTVLADRLSDPSARFDRRGLSEC